MSSVRGKIDRVSRASTSRELFEADEHEWIEQQIAALRSGRLHDIDREIIAEILDDMRISDRRELRSRFSVLLQHLLKLRMQPEKATRSWLATIVEQQDQISSAFRDTPSITREAERLYVEAYPPAVRKAAAEIGIPVRQFPPTSPWTIDEALAFAVPELPAPSVSRRTRSSRSHS